MNRTKIVELLLSLVKKKALWSLLSVILNALYIAASLVVHSRDLDLVSVLNLTLKGLSALQSLGKVGLWLSTALREWLNKIFGGGE